jgi:recombination protein RecA
MAILPLRVPTPETQPQIAPWSLESLAGRLVEIAGSEDGATLSLAAYLVLDAQRVGEQAAWIIPGDASCFAPDLADSGIDLDALVVVRARARGMGAGDGAAGARAADKLIRSGSFGVVIVDLGTAPRIPAPLLARLASLAQRHHAALVFLTQHTGATAPTGGIGASSLGSLISLRVRARRQRIAADRYRCWLEVLKDKRRGPTWGYEEVCRGAPGMR